MKLKIFRYLAKLNVAIILLLLIAGFSILGTVIEQDQTLEFYKLNYSLNWSRILFLGLDHVYRTWWYIGLLILFGTSLISCTFIQQFPALKVARRTKFQTKPQQFKKQTYTTSLNISYFDSLLINLKNKNFSIFQQRKSIYSYKGILGRFAPIIVHISMLLILFGSIVAALGGFKSQELITKGEIFQIQNTINPTPFSKVPNFPIRVNDFWIEYNNGNIKQFYSDLAILNNGGKEIQRKTISVNFPLRYKQLTIYQTDWNAVGIRIKINSSIYQLPLTPISNGKNLWISWIPLPSTENQNEGVTFICNNLEGSYKLYDSNGNLIGNFLLGDNINLRNQIQILEIIPETGLQIKADPGIPLIYLGFGTLMISTLVSYLSYTQFWLYKEAQKVFIGGETNRAKLNLQVIFLDLTLPYKKI
jgi:cytochrome c biogenesis protein